MAFCTYSPDWFHGYDIALELLFAVILLIVAIFALRIYRTTRQRNVMLFGLAFFLISISYLVQSVFNFLIISQLNSMVCLKVGIGSVEVFNYLGLFSHVLLMTAGFVILIYMACGGYKSRLLFLLLSLTLPAIFLSGNPTSMFYLFSTVYLFFLSWHFIENFLKNRHFKSLLVASAFSSLLLANAIFIFLSEHGRKFYAIGHLTELFAYLLILLNLYLVLKKNGSEKGPP